MHKLTNQLITMIALVIIFTFQLPAAADFISTHCKPQICTPCFSKKVSCLTSSKSEVVPQYLDPGITSLDLKFKSTDGTGVQLRLRDMLRYPNIKVFKLSGDFTSISLDVMASLHNLSMFQLSRSKIKSLPDRLLASNRKLIRLSFYDNSLTGIPVNILPSTGPLPLTKFVFSGHDNTSLPCRNNSMVLPQEFSRIYQLDQLLLERNTFMNKNCPTMSDEFFGAVEKITYLSVAGSKFPDKLEHSIKSLARLRKLDVGKLAPYKFCPTTAQALFDSLPETVQMLYLTDWETIHQVANKCIVTSQLLQRFSYFSLKALSFAYGDGIFGTILSKDLFPKMDALEQLDLTSCRINIIEKDALAKLPKLKHLTLTGNPLGPKDLDFLSSPLKSVIKLSLISTAILSGDGFVYENPGIFCDFPNLQGLQFDSNAFQRLPQFQSNKSACKVTTCAEVTSFTADRNLLTSFIEDEEWFNNICAVFPNLSRLSLNYNKLEDLSGLELCSSLTTLSLYNNKLSYADGTQSPEKLSEIFHHLSRLETIQLSHNRFGVIDKNLLTGMPRLRSLELDDNYIVHLHPAQFHNNTELTSITLSHNLLESIHGDLLRNLIHLVTLELRNTRLTSPSPDFLFSLNQLPKLRTLDLLANPYYCGCDKTFQKWLNSESILMPTLVYINCSTPEEQKGQQVYNYKEDVWECHIKDIIIIGGSICGGFLITLSIALPCYKYRWYVTHAKVVMKALAGTLDLVKLEHTFPYDAYVSVNPKSAEDSEWVVQELLPAIEVSKESEPMTNRHASSFKVFRLFLEWRDSLSGTNRFTERVTVLEKCKRILIIVSNSYLKSAECLSEADLTGMQMHGTEFYQPNRVMLLIREEPSEEILKPPMSALLRGKTLTVETEEQKKKLMWKKIRRFLSEPIYTYPKSDRTAEDGSDLPASEREEEPSESSPLLSQTH